MIVSERSESPSPALSLSHPTQSAETTLIPPPTFVYTGSPPNTFSSRCERGCPAWRKIRAGCPPPKKRSSTPLSGKAGGRRGGV
eukprot:scaffold135160_cov30-Phaeocystis_antarctica.AAC.1